MSLLVHVPVWLCTFIVRNCQIGEWTLRCFAFHLADIARFLAHSTTSRMQDTTPHSYKISDRPPVIATLHLFFLVLPWCLTTTSAAVQMVSHSQTSTFNITFLFLRPLDLSILQTLPLPCQTSSTRVKALFFDAVTITIWLFSIYTGTYKSTPKESSSVSAFTRLCCHVSHCSLSTESRPKVTRQAYPFCLF